MNPRSQNRDRSLGAVSGAPGKLQIPRLPAVAQDDIVDLDPMRIAVIPWLGIERSEEAITAEDGTAGTYN